MYLWWADNAVSCTVEYDPATETEELLGCITAPGSALIRSMALFPRQPALHYPQLPLVPITAEQYEKMAAQLRPLDLSGATHEVDEAGCEGEHCVWRAETARAVGGLR